MATSTRWRAWTAASGLIGVLVLVSCGAIEPAVSLDAVDVRLTVIDEAGLPVRGAQWEAAGNTTASDASGVIELSLDQPVSGVVTAPGMLAEPVVLSPEVGPEVEVAMWATVGPDGGRRLSLHFGGDVMLGRRYLEPGGDQEPLVITGDGGESARRVVADVAPVMSAADLSTVNLESVVGSLPEAGAYPGKRYLIQSPPEVLSALDEMGVDVVTLGNNHVYDWLDAGVASTLNALDGAGLVAAGAGLDDVSAGLPGVATVDGVTVATLSYTTVTGDVVNDALPVTGDLRPEGLPDGDAWPYEARLFGYGSPGVTAHLPSGPRTAGDVWRWLESLDLSGQEAAWAEAVVVYPELQDWVARRGHGGAARFSRLAVEEGVAAAREGGADVVIVQIHGGYQFSEVASSFFRTAARASADAGADLVIGHHPHVIHGFEWHGDTLIAQSLGNLVFDQDFHASFASMVLRVVVEGGHVLQARVYPVLIEDYRPVPATGALADRILSTVAAASAQAAPSDRLPGGKVGRVVGAPDSATDADLVRSGNSALVVRAGTAGDRFSLVEGGAAPGAEAVGVDLLSWGSLHDHLADGRLASGGGWAVEAADGVTTVVAEPGRLGLRLESTRTRPALLRAQARLPLDRNRFFDEAGNPLDEEPRYTLRIRAAVDGSGTPYARLDAYAFDDSDPLRSPSSERLSRTEIDLPLEEVDGWQVVEVEVPAEVTAGGAANALMLYLGLPEGSRTAVTVSDVWFLEWRPGSALPIGVRQAVADGVSG